jgi:hypothetical protein
MPFQLESPQSMRNRNTQQNNLTGIAKAIKEFADVKAQKTKIQADIAVNELKASQNLFWKMQEEDMRNKKTKELIKNDEDEQWASIVGPSSTGGSTTPQNGTVMPGTPEQAGGMSVFDMPIRPELRVGAEGKVVPHYPTAQEFWTKRIQMKESRGMKLDEREQRFKDKITGGGKSEEDSTIITKSPLKQVGAFDPRRALPDFASYNDTTKKVISNLKTKADIEELLRDRADYEKAGVDVMAIADYYTK